MESASPHEVKLVEATIDSGFTQYAPDKLVGDKAYDSDRLDEQLLHERGVEMIAPHRRGRKKSPTQDGRKLRRYRRRWKVERLFAWLQMLLLGLQVVQLVLALVSFQLAGLFGLAVIGFSLWVLIHFVKYTKFYIRKRTHS